MESAAILSRVAPVLRLTSIFAQDVHTLLYLIGNVETALHQFVDRELLGTEPWQKRREHGARLQDALTKAVSLKSTVKASLLAGGIASLLHLFALTMRRLNGQLEQLISIERSGDAYAELAGVAVSAAVLRRTHATRHKHVRALATAAGAACAARAALLRLRRRRHLQLLNRSQERLNLLLQLWWLATSVLQRAKVRTHTRQPPQPSSTAPHTRPQLQHCHSMDSHRNSHRDSHHQSHHRRTTRRRTLSLTSSRATRTLATTDHASHDVLAKGRPLPPPSDPRASTRGTTEHMPSQR
jgi:hypothetical protein